MYEKFTDRARKTMQSANIEAMRFQHEYIGTEHVLLALIGEQVSVARAVLKNLDIDVSWIRQAIEKLVQEGPDAAPAASHPQTPRAKKVIEYAIEESRRMQHDYVGSEHLLLGLLREEEGVAAQVLMNEGLTLDEARNEVRGLVKSGIRAKSTPLTAKSRLAQKPIEDLPEELKQALTHLDSEIKRAIAAKEEAVAAQQFEEAAALRDHEYKLRRERKQAIHDWAVNYPIDMRWLTHNNWAVISLAHEINRLRCWEALPKLADALAQAGCDDARLLAHCRQGGPHAEHCWVVDLLLAGVEPPDVRSQ